VTFEAAIHETVHLNSAFDGKQNRGKFQIVFGNNYNERVAEYFTEKVLDVGMNGAPPIGVSWTWRSDS
jgi:hypothetical protein